MEKIKVKGYEFNTVNVKDSASRRAIQFKNNIITTLKKIGLQDYQVKVKLEAFAIKKAPASASWYYEGHHLYYSFSSAKNFVENLFIVSKIIEYEVNALVTGQKTIQEFTLEFSEDHDVEDQRKKAREVLGVNEDELNLEIIDKKYKLLAKEHHPDMPTGNAAKFKIINEAHKTLKRELQ